MQISKDDIEATRVARWRAVKPYEEAFVENRIPGPEKNLYKIIIRGVIEYKDGRSGIRGEHRLGISMIEVPLGPARVSAPTSPRRCSARSTVP